MNIKELRALTLLIKYGTVSHVADILNMTQPGVSRILKSLEHKIQRQLFYHHNNKLIPTKYALQLSESALPVLEDFDALSDTFMNTPFPDISHIKIIAPNIFGMLLTAVLKKMHKSSNPASINLSAASSTQVITKMTQHLHHLGGIAHNTPIAGDLQVTTLAHSPIRCIVHKDSPLAQHTIITPDVLQDQRIIHGLHNNAEETKNINRMLRKVRTTNMAFYHVDTYMACELVANNMGVAFMSDIIAKMLQATTDQVHIIPLSETFYQTLQWVTLPHSTPHPNVQTIMETTSEIISQYSPESSISL